MQAIDAVGASSCRRIVEYLELSTTKVSCGLSLTAGITLTQLRTICTLKRASQLRKSHPEWDLEKVALALDYDGRGAMWNVLHSHTNRPLVDMIDPALLTWWKRAPLFTPAEKARLKKEFKEEWQKKILNERIKRRG